MSIEALFKDRRYCLDEICRIREAWGCTTTFTSRMIEAARWTLGFMLLYAPMEIQITVEATISELDRREVYFLLADKPTGEGS